MRLTRIGSLLAVLLVTACYHTTISTGVAPLPGETRKDWAHGYLWGIIGPETVRTDGVCKHGVSLVETEHSFLNMLVSALSLGIYTPVTIRFRCAAPRPAL